jgi:hypothetical protein
MASGQVRGWEGLADRGSRSMEWGRSLTRRAFWGRAGAWTGVGFLGAAGAAQAEEVGIGVGADLGGRRIFPADDPWNRDISRLPVDPNSATLIRSIGADKPLHPDFGPVYQGVPNGIPYVVVSATQPRVPVRFEAADESDPGPYPIPPDASIEGVPAARGDRHILVIDRDAWKLYELFAARPEGRGWRAGSGAIFDLTTGTRRPAGWTSADAAGLPILPGLARYDEVVGRGALRHALRFTCVRTRRAYVAPATHFASRSNDPRLPPMGMRVRLKASFDTAKFPPQARVILDGLKRHGLLLADNGGDWFISGAPDPRWDDEQLAALKRVKGHDLEVVRMGPMVTR